MIQMTDNQVFVAALTKPMEQRNRVASARDADEIASVGRKPAKKIFIFPIQHDLTSNVQSNDNAE